VLRTIFYYGDYTDVRVIRPTQREVRSGCILSMKTVESIPYFQSLKLVPNFAPSTLLSSVSDAIFVTRAGSMAKTDLGQNIDGK
jgi:hypothetical protein